MAELGNPLPKDANGNPIPVAYSIAMEDISDTPLVSPLTTITTVQTFTPPANAIVFWIRSTAEGRFGDNATLDGTSGEGYGLLPADEWKPFPCADGSPLYFKPDSSATIYFYFEVME